MEQPDLFHRLRMSAATKRLRVLVTGLGAAAVILGWAYYISLTPDIVIPSPPMPSPNAFQYFDRAVQSLPEHDDPSSALYGPHFSLARKQVLVAQNAAVLHTLRQGLAFPYFNPPLRSFAAETRYYSRDATLARLLCVEAQVKAGRDDWNGALNSDLDAVQLGVALPHGSPLIGWRRGIDCQDTGRMAVWPLVKHLTAAQAETAAHRMETITAGQADFSDTLQEEKWRTQAGLLEMMRSPDWRNQYRQLNPDRADFAEKVMQARLTLMNKRSLIGAYTAVFDAAQVRTHAAYHSHPTVPHTWLGPITEDLADSLQEFWYLDTANRAQNNMLTATLALRAYRQEHGVYPVSLQALAPAYLSRTPVDPFDAGRPLRYRRSRSAYVLYSIGPDGRNDGGTPVVNVAFPTRSPEMPNPRYVVDSSSRGDFVAGINTGPPLRGSM